MKKKTVKTFDIASLKPEDGYDIVPKSEDTLVMFTKLNELKVGQSYTMPRSLLRIFVNAKVTLKRRHNKTFIYRNLDKYNMRCWRVEDGKILRAVTKRKNK